MKEFQILKKTELLGKDFVVYGTVEEPLFLAKDVAAWIGHSNTSMMLNMVDDDEKVKIFGTLPALSKDYKPCVSNTYTGANYYFLTENGVYEVLMQSNVPIAKQFKKGVKEILKSIRKTGGYIATQQNDTPEMIMARALRVADETIKRNEQRVRELEAQTELQASTIDAQKKELTAQAPKAEYYDKTLASTDCITTTQVADDLGMSAKALNAKLRDNGIIYHQSGQWHLTAKFKTWNLHGTRTYSYTKEDGTTGTKQTLVWNQRGKRFILALYNNDFSVREAIAEIKGEM